MEFKGTKGKWAVDDNYPGMILTESGAYKPNSLLKAYCSKDELKANAKLIAAAPELLEALQELIQVKDYKDKYGEDGQYEKSEPIAWNNAIKAIEKALKY